MICINEKGKLVEVGYIGLEFEINCIMECNNSYIFSFNIKYE